MPRALACGGASNDVPAATNGVASAPLRNARRWLVSFEFMRFPSPSPGCSWLECRVARPCCGKRSLGRPGYPPVTFRNECASSAGERRGFVGQQVEMPRVTRREALEREPQEKIGRIEIRIPCRLAAHACANPQVALDQRRHHAGCGALETRMRERQARKHALLHISHIALQFVAQTRCLLATVG